MDAALNPFTKSSAGLRSARSKRSVVKVHIELSLGEAMKGEMRTAEKRGVLLHGCCEPLWKAA